VTAAPATNVQAPATGTDTASAIDPSALDALFATLDQWGHRRDG
jgi:hypothetical protein